MFDSDTDNASKGILVTRSLAETDRWSARLAIAQPFEALSPVFSLQLMEPFFGFLQSQEELGDRHPHVRSVMLSAASKARDLHGKEHLQALISTNFEKHLTASNGTGKTAKYVKEAAVILLGRIARHLDSGDHRIPDIAGRLKDTLKTPSKGQATVSQEIDA